MVYGEAIVAVAQSTVCLLAIPRQHDPLDREEHHHRKEGGEDKAI